MTVSIIIANKIIVTFLKCKLGFSREKETIKSVLNVLNTQISIPD